MDPVTIALNSRIANKAPTLFLCLLAGWPSGKKLFSPLAAARGQCRHSLGSRYAKGSLSREIGYAKVLAYAKSLQKLGITHPIAAPPKLYVK